MTERPLRSSWLRATMLGWILGVPAIIALAGIAEAVGQHALHVPVGAGMGLAIGACQARVITAHLGHGSPWFWSSLVGLAAPFLTADIARMAGLTMPYSLYAFMVAGGLVVGLWQALLLRRVTDRPFAWVIASVLGWLLASGAVALADLLFRVRALAGIPGAIAYLGLVAGGGVVLALVTSGVLAGLLGDRTDRVPAVTDGASDHRPKG